MPKANQKKIEKANANMGMLFLVVGSVLALVVGGFLTYIGLFLNANLAATFDSTLNPTAASGTLTWSANSSCGDYVNITNGGLTSFYINVTGTGINCNAAPSWAAVVSIINPYNTSTGTATNLTTAINANATVSALMVATNPSAGVVKLTYSTTGTAGNAVSTTEQAANASWAASTLTGGLEGTAAWASTKNNVMTGYAIIGILFIIIGAAGCILALMSVVGYASGGRQR